MTKSGTEEPLSVRDNSHAIVFRSVAQTGILIMVYHLYLRIIFQFQEAKEEQSTASVAVV